MTRQMNSKQHDQGREAGGQRREQSPPAGDANGNAANPDAGASAFDEAHYRFRYRDAPYYSTGREWKDYAPAYRYGHEAHVSHCGRSFAEVEQELARQWERVKDGSRLAWAEARGAVRDAWRRLDDARPGGLRRGRGRQCDGRRG